MSLRQPRAGRDRLWLLVVSPTIWAAHFLLCYVTAAVWCGKLAERDGSLGPVRAAIAAYSLVALAGIAWNGWSGARRFRSGSESPEQDLDTPGDRRGFLGLATLLLSGLSAVATIFAAIAAAFFEDCR